MQASPSYGDLVDQLHDALAVERQAFARMKRCKPGSPEGARFARLVTAAQRRADELRRAARNHPDAPPAG